MARYCLTFEAKDALSWDPEELKLLISERLLENKALYLENPVPNTILFEDEYSESNEGDPDMDADYQELLDDLKE